MYTYSELYELISQYERWDKAIIYLLFKNECAYYNTYHLIILFIEFESVVSITGWALRNSQSGR